MHFILIRCLGTFVCMYVRVENNVLNVFKCLKCYFFIRQVSQVNVETSRGDVSSVETLGDGLSAYCHLANLRYTVANGTVKEQFLEVADENLNLKLRTEQLLLLMSKVNVGILQKVWFIAFSWMRNINYVYFVYREKHHVLNINRTHLIRVMI